MIQFGKDAYKAYVNAIGEDLPQWDDLPDKVRNAWTVAATEDHKRVLEYYDWMVPSQDRFYASAIARKDKDKTNELVIEMLKSIGCYEMVKILEST